MGYARWMNQKRAAKDRMREIVSYAQGSDANMRGSIGVNDGMWSCA
jgi:hypothetical protein